MKIYIVNGIIHEDGIGTRDWQVKAFANKATAEAFRNKVETRAKDLYAHGQGRPLLDWISLELEKQNEFDPCMRMSPYACPMYFVTELEMET